MGQIAKAKTRGVVAKIAREVRDGQTEREGTIEEVALMTRQSKPRRMTRPPT
jgi:hypothetical protein